MNRVINAIPPRFRGSNSEFVANIMLDVVHMAEHTRINTRLKTTFEYFRFGIKGNSLRSVQDSLRLIRLRRAELAI